MAGLGHLIQRLKVLALTPQTHLRLHPLRPMAQMLPRQTQGLLTVLTGLLEDLGISGQAGQSQLGRAEMQGQMTG